MTGASVLRVAIQITILPIIGRLLGPHAYGEIALVSPFIIFAMVIAESGLGACIVRAERLSKELQGTVFCFSTFVSLLIITIFAILAYPLGLILGEPTFPYLLMGMSSILLLAAFIIVPAALLLRNKEYSWIALSDVVATMGGVLTVVICITLNFGVWSLVTQQIVFWLCKVGVVVFGSKYRPYFIFHWAIIKENIRFGSNLTASSVFAFIAKNIDNILIGTFMGSEILGYYALAFQIASLPQMVLSGSVYFTIFSETSEAHRSGKVNANQFLRTLKGILLISSPIIVGLAITAPLSVPLLLGDKWIPVIKLIILLMPFGFCQTFGAAIVGVIIGLGRADIALRLTLFSAVLTITAIVIGINFNSNAVALGVSLAAIASSYFSLSAIVKLSNTSFREICKAMYVPLLSSIFMGSAVFLIGEAMPTYLPLLLRLCVCVVFGAFIYITTLFTLFRQHIAEDVLLMKRIIIKRIAKEQ